MTKKPVKVWCVVICLILIACVAATLIIPMFSLKIDSGGISGDYVNVTGLDMLNTLFGQDYASASEGTKQLLTFIGKGATDYSQYINPIYINIMLYTYAISLGLATLMLIFSLFNLCGYRLSVFNVLAGLLILLSGIIIVGGIILQNRERIANAVVDYDFRLSYGAIALLVIGFIYMMFAPKKRV